MLVKFSLIEWHWKDWWKVIVRHWRIKMQSAYLTNSRVALDLLCPLDFDFPLGIHRAYYIISLLLLQQVLPNGKSKSNGRKKSKATPQSVIWIFFISDVLGWKTKKYLTTKVHPKYVTRWGVLNANMLIAFLFADAFYLIPPISALLVLISSQGLENALHWPFTQFMELVSPK